MTINDQTQFTVHNFSAVHNLSEDALRKAIRFGRLILHHPRYICNADYSAYRTSIAARFVERYTNV